jgi:uncharacterized protein
MLFVIHGHDRPEDGAAIRRCTRPEHLRFVLANPGVFRYGGPLLDEQGQTIGSLMLIDLPDRKALDRFLAEEPYCRNRLFAPLHVHPSRQVVPEIAPGLLAKELAREELAALTDG